MIAALLYIGQTPREDITSEIRALLPSAVRLREYGFLDGLSEGELDALRAREDEPCLITRLRDGRSAAVSEKRILPFASRACALAEREGADAAVLMCTGAFPPLGGRVPLITAHEAVHGGVPLPAPLGVVAPEKRQAEQMVRWWGEQAPLLDFASPYGEEQAVVDAAKRLKARNAQAICLDCMGYTNRQAERVFQQTGLPVFTPRRMVAQAILRMLQEE